MRGSWVGVGVALLLGALLAQSLASLPYLSATFDEVTHLPSGYTYLTFGEIRMNRQHPPLVKMLAALPLLPVSPRADFYEPEHAGSAGYEWDFGRRFLYGADADALLFLGRLPIVALAAVLAVYVFVWSRERFGPAGGLLSLGLYALCPNVVAHSHLVTMDLALATFTTMALYHLWRSERTGSALHRVAAGASLGCALSSKFSALLLLPAVGVLLALPALTRSRTGAAWGHAIRTGLVVGCVAAAVLWTSYLCPADPLFYVRDLRRVNADHGATFLYYLHGEFATHFWSYFLVAFAIKTPLPTLVVLALAFAATWTRTDPAIPRAGRGAAWSTVDDLWLLAPAAIFFVATSALADNLGLRYVLPVYPLLFVFAGRAALLLAASRAGLALGVALGLWLVVGAVQIFPDHLAYYNEVAGGPENGWRWLDDSNLDWGQDLRRLAPWMREHGVDEVKLYYTGNADPGYYGIRWRELSESDLRDRPAPGVYVMSAQALIRARLAARERGWNSDWLERYEPADRVGYSLYVFRFDE